MGFQTILSPEDLKKSDLVPTGWYLFKITGYEEKPATTDKSINCYFTVQVQEPEQFKGVSPRCMFNEKALGFGKALWKALDLPWEEGVGYRLGTDIFKQTVGSYFMGYIKRATSDKGNDYNELADYMALDAKQVAAAGTK